MTPAKRGMLLVVERRHTSTTLHGATTESVDYAPAVVNTASRDGVARTAWLRSNYQIKLGTPNTRRWWVISEIPKGKDVLHALPESFDDLDAARNAIRPFLGCARSYQGE